MHQPGALPPQPPAQRRSPLAVVPRKYGDGGTGGKPAGQRASKGAAVDPGHDSVALVDGMAASAGEEEETAPAATAAAAAAATAAAEPEAGVAPDEGRSSGRFKGGGLANEADGREEVSQMAQDGDAVDGSEEEDEDLAPLAEVRTAAVDAADLPGGSELPGGASLPEDAAPPTTAADGTLERSRRRSERAGSEERDDPPRAKRHVRARLSDGPTQKAHGARVK
jgi:hypothetical protein